MRVDRFLKSRTVLSGFWKAAVVFLLATGLAGCQAGPNGETFESVPIPMTITQPLPESATRVLHGTPNPGQPGTWISYTDGNDVAKIATDRNGNLWSAGSGGVVRWDPQGGTVQKYTSSDGLPENDITALAIAPSGKIWAGTAHGFVAFLSQGKWTTLKARVGDMISTLAIAADEAVWAGTNQGISKYDGSTWQAYTRAQGLIDNFVQSIGVLSDGTVWAGGMGGVSIFDGHTWTNRHLSTGSLITSIAQAPDGSVWLGSDQALIQFDGKTWSTYLPAEDTTLGAVGSILFDRQGDPWFSSTRLGLAHFSPGKASLIHYPLENVSGIAMGSQDTIWVGQRDGGVSLFSGKNLDHYTSDDPMLSNFILSGASGSDGSLWFGTMQGLQKYDGTTWQSFTNGDGLPKNGIRSMAAAPDGSMWFGTDRGAAHFDGSTWKNYTAQDGLADNRVLSIPIAPDGTVWLVSQNGVARLDGDHWSTFPYTNLVTDHSFRTIAAAQNGVLWIGTNSGLARFGGQNWLEVDNYRWTTSLHLSDQGDLWIGTQDSGVYFVDHRAWDQIPTGDPHLKSVSINPDGIQYQIADENGNLNEVPVKGSFVRIYTQADGLPKGSINALKSGPDGSLWAATDLEVLHLVGDHWLSLAAPGSPQRDTIHTLLIDARGTIWAGMRLSGLEEYVPQP